MSSLNVTKNSEYEPIGEATYQFLENPAQDDEVLHIFGYKPDSRRELLYHIFCVFLFGIPYAIFTWYPSFKHFKYKKAPLRTANIIFLSDCTTNCTFLDVKTEITDLPTIGPTRLRFFTYQHSKYIWVANKGVYSILNDFVPKLSLDDILDSSHGLLEIEEKTLIRLYGHNTIEIEVKSYWRLFVEEVFNPFYIFQIFSVILWYFDDYVIYAGCVLLLTFFSIVTALHQTRKQSVALHNLVESSNSGKVEILRRHLISETAVCSAEPTDLVPGDVLVIPRTGCIMPCDAVLLSGHCIVNESMLTGESVPVTKTPPNPCNELYNIQNHKAHTIFSGTHIIQGRFYGGERILARVIHTGFDTTKGSLVKSIMFPAPIGFKFYKDSLKFVTCLFLVAATGMSYCLYLYIQRDADVREMIIRALDIITIVVPPALPAAMTVGIVFSQKRLKKLGIYCISPPRINICGKLKLACFDKTGTLTHEGLDLYSVVPTKKGIFDEAVSDVNLFEVTRPIVQAMATCHSLTRIDGKLNGDPLDLNMFENTKWELEEPGQEENNYDTLAPTIVKPEQKYISTSQLHNPDSDMEIPYEIGIIRQFQFSSSLQRMSVICKVLGTPNMVIFSKGAPEKLQSMCKSETVPLDFATRLAQFTAQGFRVIAIAYKPLPIKFKWKDSQKVKRDVVECDLIFLGFIIMQNTLKPQTTPVISTLHAANIRTVMITGDNVMTAICVARDCGMVKVHDTVIILQMTEESEGTIPKIFIDNIGSTNEFINSVVSFDDDHYHFAIDGRTWSKLRHYYPDLIPKLLLRSTIFARFQPDQKTQLIISFQSLDYIVSMVGDGANDCGALKAAHIGVSLSQAEASVAAPFTSRIEDISCLIHLMLEGRCALVTSFAVFKYMALYSLIQFITILILYKRNSILGDQQFLFIDLIITTSLAVTICRQGPYHKLVPKRPMGSLVSGTNLIPMITQILLCSLFQLGSLYYLTLQKWYIPNPPGKDEVIVCWDNTVLFTVSCFQYVTLAVVYSKGEPYRELLITNFWLLICALTLTCFTTYLMVAPAKFIAEFFDVIFLPSMEHQEHEQYLQHIFRYILLFFPVLHFVAAFIIEYCVSESKWLKTIVHFITRKKNPKNKFKILLKETDFKNWFHEENEAKILLPPQSIQC